MIIYVVIVCQFIYWDSLIFFTFNFILNFNIHTIMIMAMVSYTKKVRLFQIHQIYVLQF